MANNWTWPFHKPYTGSFEEGQQFGQTSYHRPGGSYFHDGFDFGSAIYGQGSDILAVSDGEVIYTGVMGNGLGSVIVLSIPPYQVMYQEFSTSTSDIFVQTGQHVTEGQRIGRLSASHLHLGITKENWQTALGSWSVDNGTWLNPITIIQNGATGSGNQTFEGEEDMFLVETTDTHNSYVVGATGARHVKTTKFLDALTTKIKLPQVLITQAELNAEFGNIPM